EHRLPELRWHVAEDFQQAERCRVDVGLADRDPAEHRAVRRHLVADHLEPDAAEARAEVRLDPYPDPALEIERDEAENIDLQWNIDRVAATRDFEPNRWQETAYCDHQRPPSTVILQ